MQVRIALTTGLEPAARAGTGHLDRGRRLGGLVARRSADRAAMRRMAQLRRNLRSVLLTSGQISRQAPTPDAEADASWSVGSLPYGVAIAAGTIAVLFASS